VSGSFGAELSRVQSRVGKNLYGVPWYLVLGEPMVGKSTFLRSANLTLREAPIEGQYCHYWIANEAVFVEAREPLCGPNKNLALLRDLVEGVMQLRPREPLDGIVLVMSATDVAERSDEPLEEHAQHLRSSLIEICRTLQVDIPVYVVVNRYDTLWGFAEVFSWNADRAKEDAWGFLVHPTVPSQETWPKAEEGLRGLSARIEAQCLQKLSSEDGIEQRIRSYQHLVEARVFLERLREVLKILAFSSAYERAPWLRSATLGSSVPGAGDRIRAGMARFANMGLSQNPYDPHRSPRPGGLPLHGFLRGVVLPEKELVPLKVRWRDDPICVVGFILGALFFVGSFIVRYAL
jgi:type VI protein secretion system component VasK